MRKMTWLLGVALLATIFVSSGLLAQQLPPGVKMEVLKEYPPSVFPGAKSVKRLRFTLAPGAKVENFVPPGIHFCMAAQGEATVVVQGKTVVRKAGQQWIEEKGVPFSMVNNGTVPFVDEFFQVIY